MSRLQQQTEALEALLHKVQTRRRVQFGRRPESVGFQASGLPATTGPSPSSRAPSSQVPSSRAPSSQASASQSRGLSLLEESAAQVQTRNSPSGKSPSGKSPSELSPRRSGRPEQIISESPQVVAITPQVDLQHFDRAQPFQTVGMSRAPEPATLRALIARSLELKPKS